MSVTITSNGSGHVGTIEEWEERLRTYKLDPRFGEFGCFESTPMSGGVARFWGNFENYSAVFDIETDDPKQADKWRAMICANPGYPEAAYIAWQDRSKIRDERDELATRCAELEGALRLLIDHADTCATGLRSGTLSASQASAFLVGERLNVGATTEARAVLAKGAK